MGTRYPLMALAVGVLALGSGCLTDGKKSESKKPDVTQPGVLPPPQETTRSAASTITTGAVVPASATMPAPQGAMPQAAAGPSSRAKVAAMMERKVIATELAVGWQNRIAYLADPVRNGKQSPGIAGQMFLFGDKNLEFVLADGTLTVDMVDETPRPAGQPAATPERWQFDKATLRNLQTRDETWGRSYVLFLPWPAYKSDITKVRISARYDPDNGNTMYATPSTVTLDTTPFGTPVWSDKPNTESRPSSLGAGSMTGMGGFPAGSLQPGGVLANQPGAPIPVGGGIAPGPLPGAMLPPNAIMPNGAAPMPVMPGAMITPNGPTPSVAPKAGLVLPEGFPPLTITLPGARQQ